MDIILYYVHISIIFQKRNDKLNQLIITLTRFQKHIFSQHYVIKYISYYYERKLNNLKKSLR